MRDNGLFLNSGHNYPLLPVYPPPPKTMLYFGPSSLSFTTSNIDSGVGGFTAIRYNEING